MSRTILIDASNLLHRTYHVAKNTNNNHHEMFLISCRTLMQRFKTNDIYAVWDAPSGTNKNYRKKVMVAYKENRDRDDYPNIFKNHNLFKELLTYGGIKSLTPNELEADDAIAWLTWNIPKSTKITIVSPDRDLLQLVSENVQVLLPNNDIIVTTDNFTNQTGVPKRYFVIHKAMQGDSSDNIPGIGRVGPKTATKLIYEKINTNCKWSDLLEPEKLDKLKANLEVMDLRVGFRHHKQEGSVIADQYNTMCQIKPDFEAFEQGCSALGIHSIASNIYNWKNNYFKYTPSKDSQIDDILDFL